MTGGVPDSARPLAVLRSIKVKLGVLVAASVLVATVLSTIGAADTVPPWLAIPVTVAAALAVTQLLAIGMVAPLRQMTDAAGRMARGDYRARVDATSRDEVGELARAFNTMAEDLATVDQQRRDLIGMVSHELRTPLAALSAVIENLADGVVAPDPTALRAAAAQTERLTALVTDLLDLSRLEAGISRLQPAEIDVADLLASCVTEAEIAGRRVGFAVDVGAAGATVVADEARLRQVVANLLDNAARYSPPGAEVRISADARDGRWWLEVTDQGPGVDPADRERAFERFGQLDQREAAGGAGTTGLGLAIARWVADLHAGTVRFVDPVPGEGACVRLELPLRTTAPPGRPGSSRPSGDHRSPRWRPDADAANPDPSPRRIPVTPTPAASRPAAHTPEAPVPPARLPAGATQQAPEPVIDLMFGSVWPEPGSPAGTGTPAGRGLAPAPAFVASALVVGLLGAIAFPDRALGLGTFLVFGAAGATVAMASLRRGVSPFRVSCFVLAGLSCLPTMLLAADWIAVLCLLAGIVLLIVAVTEARTLPGFLLAGLAWPMSGLRGLPWLGRTLRIVVRGGRTMALIRTAVLSVLAVAAFGTLFASADALFAEWVGAALPDLRVDSLVLRAFLTCAIGGVVLATCYLALNPPRVEPRLATPRPTQRRFEWLAPVLLVDVVFVVFLVAQATAFFGGHAYLQEATGLTYAQYVHQGFGQLTVATALTLLVVWAAARKAARETAADRLWLRAALGALCVLTLVVVASALYRMHVYQQAYGFTQLRVLVDLFEAWLGLLVVAVMAGLGTLRTGWLPRFALISGVIVLLGLAAVNPDAWVARQNIARFEATGKIDLSYLSGLSVDAVPELVDLPQETWACAMPYPPPTDDWLGWNLGRWRAAHYDYQVERDLTLSAACELE